jgi:hypothetical protein
MSEMFATRIETSDLTAAVTLFSTSRRVVGITVANTTGLAETVDFTTGDGLATALFTVEVGINDTIEMNIPFIADKGLRVNTANGAGVVVTAFTGADGS